MDNLQSGMEEHGPSFDRAIRGLLAGTLSSAQAARHGAGRRCGEVSRTPSMNEGGRQRRRAPAGRATRRRDQMGERDFCLRAAAGLRGGPDRRLDRSSAARPKTARSTPHDIHQTI